MGSGVRAARNVLAVKAQVRILAPQFPRHCGPGSDPLRRGSVRPECEHMFVPRYSESEARAAVAGSISYSEAMRRLGLRPAGGNHRHFRRYVDEIWQIPTDHFDPSSARLVSLIRHAPVPLEDVLVEGSSYSRRNLKLRLYDTGLKERRCELCGQDEIWRGKPIALILDHINGVPDDNRLENLRIVCPNCNSTFDTHCGRKNRAGKRDCRGCGRSFFPHYLRQKYCSAECGSKQADRVRKLKPHLSTRRVERPSHEQLLSDVDSMSMVAVGHKYGVSDNAVRKWLRWYRQAAELATRRAEADSGSRETEAA
jgi:hypothetical protein